MVLVLRISEPDIRYGHAAGEPDLAVYDDRAAMVPPVKTRQFAELGRPEFLDFAAGLYQRFEVCVRHIDAAETVQQHAHGDAFALFFFERCEQLIAERAFRPDVHRKVDGALCAANGVEQRRNKLVAVVQCRDSAAVLDGRAAIVARAVAKWGESTEGAGASV